jgi:hypothetical protein
MSRNIAGEIEKEYGDYTFKSPKIYFGYNKIEISNGPLLIEKLLILPGIVFLVFMLLYFDFSIPPFFLIILGVLCIYVMFLLFQYKKTEIDFLNGEIKISNFWKAAEFIDKIQNKKKLFSFAEIAGFENRVSKRGQELRKNILVMVAFDHSPVNIAAFPFERESRRLGELLFRYIKRLAPTY